ncbi:hypothetical protein PIB30_087394, partial [Stylosanthes scabra]|nr:hypothetical protein [Stylosanthes scabra]
MPLSLSHLNATTSCNHSSNATGRRRFEARYCRRFAFRWRCSTTSCFEAFMMRRRFDTYLSLHSSFA